MPKKKYRWDEMMKHRPEAPNAKPKDKVKAKTISCLGAKCMALRTCTEACRMREGIKSLRRQKIMA
jgi:hypothetical protein